MGIPNPEQTSLLPPAAAARPALICLEDCPPSHLPAPAWLVESIRQNGIFQPIAVITTAGPMFHVAAGKRRVDAARRAGLTYAPALVFPRGTDADTAARIALVTNQHRSPNPTVELRAIEQLLPTVGGDPARLARELSLSSATIRARLRMTALTLELRAALDAGRIKPNTAMAAARLPRPAQDRLADRIADVGRLTNAEVAEETRRHKAAAAVQVFALVSEQDASRARPDPERDAWALAAHHLEQARAALRQLPRRAGHPLATRLEGDLQLYRRKAARMHALPARAAG